jgi:hypothetical protein
MKDAKLSVRVQSHLSENFKRYAARQGTTQSALIEAYLQSVPSQDVLGERPSLKSSAKFYPRRHPFRITEKTLKTSMGDNLD